MLSEFSIKRPVTVLMILLFLLIAGTFFFYRTSVSLIPDISVPSITVLTSFPGANQKKVEKEVTVPMESYLNQLSGLRDIYSLTREGESLIILDFYWNKNTIEALREIKEVVRAVDLPEDVYPPVVRRWSPRDKPIMRIDFSSERKADLRRWVKNSVLPEIERIKGVSKAEIAGDKKKEVFVLVSPGRLSACGIGIDELAEQIKKFSLNAYSGKISSVKKEYLVRVRGRIDRPEELKNLTLINWQGSAFKLNEVAEIREAEEKDESFAELDGRESIALLVFKDRGQNLVRINDEVRRNLNRLTKKKPADFIYKVTRDDSSYIKESQSLIKSNMILGIIIVTIVLFAFLRKVAFTVIVALTIPFSVISAFMFFKIGGINQNVLSLAGLALAVGLILDASVVILENIYRHFKITPNPYYAVVYGTVEVRKSVIASYLTTFAVFIPILTLKGLAGELFSDLSFSVVTVLVCSLFISFTFIPLACYRLLKSKRLKQEDEISSSRCSKLADRAMAGYVFLLDRLIYRKTARFSAVVVVLFLCVVSLRFLPAMVFIPQGREREVKINVAMPAGSSLSAVRKFVTAVQEKIPDKKTESIVTRGDFRSAEITVRLKPYSKKEFMATFIKELREKIDMLPAAGRITITRVDMVSSAGGLGRPVEVKITGRSWKDVDEAVDWSYSRLLKIKELFNLSRDRKDEIPSLKLNLNRAILKNYQISPLKASSQILAYLKGAEAGRTAAGEKIKVKSSADYSSVEHLLSLPVISKEGKSYNISAVARPEYSGIREEIVRYNRMRSRTLTADIAPGYGLGEALDRIKEKMPQILRGRNVYWHISGVARGMVESFDKLKWALAISVFLLYIIMAAQFESFIYPLVIMSTLILSTIGISLGLNITGENLSVSAMIGIIMLTGIVVNNGIVLIDFINILRDRGIERDEAIKRASLIRLRPIMMTSLTTILGMVPLIVGTGSGSELYRGLAVVVSFGLFFATFLTLIMVPSMYLLFDDIGELLKIWNMKLSFSLTPLLQRGNKKRWKFPAGAIHSASS